MDRIKIRRPSEKTIRILKMIGIGILMIAIGAVPSPRALARILKELIMEDTPKNRRWAKRRVYEVQRQGYVREDEGTYSLSEIGQRIVEEQKLWDLKIPIPRGWDGFWHIVVFDIPQKKINVRIPFVRHLQNLGLVFYQRSVWIHPYPFENEVRKVAIFHGLLPHLSFIVASHIDGSLRLRKQFKLSASS